MKTPVYFCDTIPYAAQIKDIARRRRVTVYLVGGFLRDSLLGVPDLSDFDFAVSRAAVSVARVFAGRVRGAFVLLDAQHGCARVVKKKDGRIYTFDFADFRGPTIRDDTALRDFTINTLCVDIASLKANTPFTDIIIDTQYARRDLARKKIRMVSPRAFHDDSLRLLRALSLQAITGFTIDTPTRTEIARHAALLTNSAWERIRDEFFKILLSARTADTLQVMDTVGLLERVIPHITVMYKVKQGGYHHLDVWRHSLETVKQLEKVFDEYACHPQIRPYLDEALAGTRTRRALLKLAALLHDIGKPDARRVKGKKTHFYGHERIGRDIVRQVALLLKLSTRERHALEDMTLWHLRPGYLSNFTMPTARAVFRYFRDAREEGISTLLLSLADMRSTRGPLTTAADRKHHEKIVQYLIAYYYDRQKEKPLTRLITGDDLIKRLKLVPSPLFSVILRAVEEKQAAGAITTKKDALAAARAIALKHKKK